VTPYVGHAGVLAANRRRGVGAAPAAVDVLGAIVRFVYLDESVTGDPTTEPHIVMVGVVVSPDRDWLRVEGHLRALADEYCLDAGQPVVFHASEIFHGSGRWPRDRYPRERRFELLKELCSIPAQFSLLVIAGWVDRSLIAETYPDDGLGVQTELGIVAAAVRCTIGVERYMRTADVGEVATLTYENNDHSKKLTRELHNALKTDSFAALPTSRNGSFGSLCRSQESSIPPTSPRRRTRPSCRSRTHVRLPCAARCLGSLRGPNCSNSFEANSLLATPLTLRLTVRWTGALGRGRAGLPFVCNSKVWSTGWSFTTRSSPTRRRGDRAGPLHRGLRLATETARRAKARRRSRGRACLDTKEVRPGQQPHSRSP
jgi:hypothetical protein